MNILVACECSGVVRDAFRSLGHNAWSCDLLPCDSPWHLQMDALQGAYREFCGWDMLIAHPPCTFLSVASVWALKDPDFEKYPGVGYHQKVKEGTLTGAARRKAQVDSVGFVRKLWAAPIRLKCFENPVGQLSSLWRKPDQIIQPHQFGDDASKGTCLWLDGLPKLKPTNSCPPRIVEWPRGSGKFVPRWGNQTDSGQNNLTPSESRASERAVTYPGIAKAMAEQWGNC